MPGKEAVVEVEKNGVVPEPVKKEVPKCDSATLEEKSKKVDSELVKAETAAAVADSADAKPQDTEITSTGEQKAEQQDPPKDKKDKEAVAESNNGSAENTEQKAEAEKTEVDSVETKNSVETTESQKNSSTDAEPQAEPTEAESKEPATVAEPAEPTKTEVAKSEAEPMETDGESSEAIPLANAEPEGQNAAAGSEAAAKPLPADDEKIVVEKESKPANPVVTGSDEAKKPETSQGAAATVDSPADSSSEKKSENPKTDDKPGSSSSTEIEPDLETQIAELKKNGLALYVRKEFCAAADVFGKVLEVAAPLYGELSEKLAETYFLYGSAMYEFGKTENGVLGDQVKEKDEEGDDEEQGDEEMEVDATPAETSPAEDSAEKLPSTPSAEDAADDKDPADETIAGEANEDDDSFRVAWEMLELAKATFRKADNKKRLADTLIKLGEVGMETDNVAGIEEMIEGLKIRKEVFPETHRIIPETHFTIGIALVAFDKYDEAIEHFTHAKNCLEKRIEELSKSDKEEDKTEVAEMKALLPEIQEKIDDTRGSKEDKEKIKKKLEGELLKEPSKEAFPASSEDKPATNITHLVKRKRKVDDILPASERAAKQSRQEDAVSTTDDATKPADSMEISEAEPKDKPKSDDKVDTPEEAKTDVKPEEGATKSGEGDTKPEEVDTKPEEVDAKPEEVDTKPEDKLEEVGTKPEETNMKPEEVDTKSEATPGEKESKDIPKPEAPKEADASDKPQD